MPVQSKSLRAQITWHTKWVEKSSEKVHKYTEKAWLEHRLEKTWKKVAHVLKMCQKGVKNGVQKGDFIFAFCPLAPPVAALALQSSSWCKKCCQRAPKMTMKWQKWLQKTLHGRKSVSKMMQKSKNLARRTARSALNKSPRCIYNHKKMCRMRIHAACAY